MQPKTVDYGVSFSDKQAKWLMGDQWRESYTAILDETGIKRVRLMSYWDVIESTKDTYDFSDLDWMINEAAARGVSVNLSLGLRQPRWPECHQPDWVGPQGTSEFNAQLFQFIEDVVERYKNTSAIKSYQLENEYFLKIYGGHNCKDFSRERYKTGLEIVKSIDDTKPVVITLSNNFWGTPIRQPKGDVYGFSIYKKVHLERFRINSYIEYPIPAWYYGFRLGLYRRLIGPLFRCMNSKRSLGGQYQ